MNKIVVNNLTKTYGKSQNLITALNDISFQLNAGEFVVVLGPSGSGKSTLLNILGGMDNATEGSVDVCGKIITDFSAKRLTEYRREDVGFVFQFYNLMPNLTALENVMLSQKKNEMTAREALSLVGLEKRLNNFPGQLSGGEQQRVAIARAIVKNPSLLLCDEPTGALDSATGKSVLALLCKLSKQTGKTIIAVTHNAKLADVADRVISLSDGKIISDAIQDKPLSAEEISW